MTARALSPPPWRCGAADRGCSPSAATGRASTRTSQDDRRHRHRRVAAPPPTSRRSSFSFSHHSVPTARVQGVRPGAGGLVVGGRPSSPPPRSRWGCDHPPPRSDYAFEGRQCRPPLDRTRANSRSTPQCLGMPLRGMRRRHSIAPARTRATRAWPRPPPATINPPPPDRCLPQRRRDSDCRRHRKKKVGPGEHHNEDARGQDGTAVAHPWHGAAVPV